MGGGADKKTAPDDRTHPFFFLGKKKTLFQKEWQK